MGEIRDIDVYRYAPAMRSRQSRLIFDCPECDCRLPVDGWTECSNCGAHLSLKVDVEVGGVSVNE